MTKRVRPPADWMDLRGGDSKNTRIVKHRLDKMLDTMREEGFEVGTEETLKGYRVIVRRSPHDTQKTRHLRVVK